MVTFAAPVMLWGLVVLLIPVILHMQNRTKGTVVHFSFLKFIYHEQLPCDGKHRLRDLLLLLLRLLIILFLILAFAKPVWHSKIEKNRVIDSKSTIFLIDCSASMAGWNSQKNLQKKIKKYLANHDCKNTTLVFSSNHLLDKFTDISKNRVLEELSKSRVENVAGNHTQALIAIQQMAKKYDHTAVVILSDFQLGDWQLLPSKFMANTTLELLDVTVKCRSNVGVLKTEITPLRGGKYRVAADIYNFGTKQQKRKLFLQVGENIQKQSVELPPLQITKIIFISKITNNKSAKIQLEADSYPLDDSWYFWLRKGEPLHALLVSGRNIGVEELFVKKALLVGNNFQQRPYVVDQISYDHLSVLNLQAVDILFLLGSVADLDSRTLAKVLAYVKRGGVVIATVGEGINQSFRNLQESGLLNLAFRRFMGHDKSGSKIYSIGEVLEDSVLKKLFVNSDLFTLSIYKYCAFKILDKNISALLKSSDGNPLLVKRQIDSGKIYLFAFALKTSWSDLPVSGSFVPLLYELLGDTDREKIGVRNFSCGENFSLGKNILGDDISISEIEKDMSRVAGVRMIAGVPCQFNIARSESVLNKINLFDLECRLYKRQLGKTDDDTEIAVQNVKQKEMHKLWKIAVMIAMLFLFLEQCTILFVASRGD